MHHLIPLIPLKSILTGALAWILLFNYGNAQETLKATRTAEKLSIDGILDEAAWEGLPVAGNFTAWQPNPGEPASDATEVRVLYDDNAIYVSAIMNVPSRDSIMTELTQRDDIGNTDWFGLVIDTYGNGNDGLEFIVGATGVQFDAKVIDQQGEDTNWDGVWFSEVNLRDKEWIVEIKIPYSAIRFSSKPIQSWKINFMRSINSIKEKSSWNFIDPNESGFLTQSGTLEGLENIKAPLRLSLSPYFSVYAQNYSDQSADISSTGYSYNGGMDLKYGINDAFTLDMTLIPDFGQVKSDDVVLNLSPFEVRYDENRPFFTEGTELFNQRDLFYSRRVGGSPIGMYNVHDNLSATEEVIENPATSQLYNATKVSGRTGSGLGVGVFNALSKETNAVIEDMETGARRKEMTSPLTNYNVFVLDQNLPNNSKISFANASVWRKGERFHDSNVTTAMFSIKNKAQSYSAYGRGTISQLLFQEEDNKVGHNINLGISKISGHFGFDAEYIEASKDYNPNDLGFLRRNNYRTVEIEAYYRIFEPVGFLNRGNFWSFFEYNRIIEPDEFMSTHYNAGFWVETKGFWNFNMWSNYEPASYDYYEPREFGRFYELPRWFNVGYWMGSDNRKPIRVSVFANYRKVSEEGRQSISIGFNPRFRLSNKFTITTNFEISDSNNEVGYVSHSDDDIIFGRRDRTTFENSINASYTFNDKMGINFRLRHYWSKLKYDSFHTLMTDGSLGTTDYEDFNDFSFNAFNIDMEYKWRFAPGSDLIVVWKNNISGFESNNLIDYNDISYGTGLKELSDLPQSNSLSLRMIYYLDYADIKKAF